MTRVMCEVCYLVPPTRWRSSLTTARLNVQFKQPLSVAYSGQSNRLTILTVRDSDLDTDHRWRPSVYRLNSFKPGSVCHRQPNLGGSCQGRIGLNRPPQPRACSFGGQRQPIAIAIDCNALQLFNCNHQLQGREELQSSIAEPRRIAIINC